MNRLCSRVPSTLLAFLVLPALLALVAPAAHCAEKDPIRVVIIVGGHPYDEANFEKAWGGHDDIRCEVRKASPYSLFDDIAGFDHDVILMYNFSSGITDPQKRNFLALLERGVGLVVWHHALANCQDWPEFEKIAGAKFWLRPGSRDGKEVPKSGVGFGKIPMRAVAPEHPITRGLGEFTIEDETYHTQTFGKGIRVLVTADHPKSDKPIAWTHRYSKARVFGYQGGHDARAWTNPAHRQILASGIRWAAGRLAADEPKTAEGGKRWIQLFNGKDLTGWTPKITGYPLGENFGNTFRVKDGVIQVGYEAYDRFNGRFGHLFYEEEFSSYRLRVEYRFTGKQTPGGPGWALRNSGLMLHGQSAESMRKDQDFPVSIEVQLLGGSGSGRRTTANLCTPGTHVVMDGKLVTRHCTSSTSETYHGDRWVTAEVEVRGNRVTHYVEGKQVLTYTDPQLDPGDADAKRLIAAGAEKELGRGTISLQSESHPVEFRKVELLELE